jgi:hypothetical protein
MFYTRTKGDRRIVSGVLTTVGKTMPKEFKHSDAYYCRELEPPALGHHWVCTREKGHPGKVHVAAEGSYGAVLSIWGEEEFIWTVVEDEK